ncbi:MAG: hypothetical protein M1816_003990 [Peltula sp. TS41687]|nr:MAG: hypothetical protein M1816_003990 [Peltula sp. TS41687]
MKIFSILRKALSLNQFPAFCGTLVGGFTLLKIPLETSLTLIQSWLRRRTGKRLNIPRKRWATFLAAFVSGWFSLGLLNNNSSYDEGKNSSGDKGSLAPQPERSLSPSSADINVRGRKQELTSGKTIDLTLFAVTRSSEVVIRYLWAKRKATRMAKLKWTFLESALESYTDSSVFAISTFFVMWAWFYQPERLPRAYRKWIQDAADVDSRLIQVLRLARAGRFVYGKDTGQALLLQSMCKEYSWPLEWGDPAETVPIPCEMIHMGTGPSCEEHALRRFMRAFRFAFKTYLPLTLALRIRSPSRKAFQSALKDAVRSSTFLGAFIGIFYYSICLARTLLGPRLFSRHTITPMMWDSGLCVGLGCLLSGWSILIETEKRRQELAMFVAPRAAATLLPRRYDKKYQWRESLAFSLSAAIVFTEPERTKYE